MVGEQQSAWSIGLGRWYGVSIRIHMLFFVFAVMTIYFGWHATEGQATPEYYTTSVVALLILLVSIFVHELAHGFTTSGCGGMVESIEVFPWGGLSEIELPSNKYCQFFIHLSGPVANLFLCFSCAVVLLFDSGFSKNGDWFQLFYPLQPIVLRENFFANTVALVFWVNWLLFLVNLLPVSPFDGGRIVRSAIPLLWPNTRTDQIYFGSMIVAMMTSIGFCILAWGIRDSQVVTLVPMWLVMLLLAIVVFFGARRQTQLDLRDLEDLLEHEPNIYGDKIMEAIENRAFDEFDDDDDQDISDWLYHHKYEQKLEAVTEDLELEDEARLDRILGRIQDVGLEGLTEQEKFALLRASAKIRQRKRAELGPAD